MLRFKETVLSFNRTMPNSLKDIYGIGKQRGAYVSNLFGFSDHYSINLINLFYFDLITWTMKHYILEDRLKLGIKNRFSLYREVGLVKVKRYDVGLPTKGQRTHSNSRTSRRNIIF